MLGTGEFGKSPEYRVLKRTHTMWKLYETVESPIKYSECEGGCLLPADRREVPKRTDELTICKVGSRFKDTGLLRGAHEGLSERLFTPTPPQP